MSAPPSNSSSPNRPRTFTKSSTRRAAWRLSASEQHGAIEEITCHAERSEASGVHRRARSFASLRMTTSALHDQLLAPSGGTGPGSVVRCLLPFCNHPAPARRSQPRGLLEAAGEMALMGEAAILGNVRQFLIAGKQLALGGMNLAIQHELFGSQAQQIREPPMKVERAEMNRLGDFDQGRPAA